MTILVLTNQFDPTADLVVQELARRGICVFRCDASEFPERLVLSADLDTGWVGWLRTADREVALGSIAAAYYRRPSRFVFADGMSATERKFAAAEARLGFGGVLASLPCRWINHPHRIAEAEYKPLQLGLAADCGLRVPRTLITNDPDDAEQFVASLPGAAVYKPLSGGPGGEHGKAVALYTTVVPQEDWGDASIHRTAHLFQEWIPKHCEARVTVVDTACFAVEIHVEHSPRAAVNWRADYTSHRYTVTEVPDSVRSRIVAIMARLGLVFGACDFVITPEGQWVFLELNPNGQWAWLQVVAGVPISAAIADALEKSEHVYE